VDPVAGRWIDLSAGENDCGQALLAVGKSARTMAIRLNMYDVQRRIFTLSRSPTIANDPKKIRADGPYIIPVGPIIVPAFRRRNTAMWNASMRRVGTVWRIGFLLLALAIALAGQPLVLNEPLGVAGLNQPYGSRVVIAGAPTR
jgi:hypothetical protein